MNNTKPIYRLPELEEHQEWACYGGCDSVEPKLFKHTYKEVWNPEGVLIEQLSEHYYTCSHGHLLSVWNSESGTDVVLDNDAYTEHTIPENLKLSGLDSLIAELQRLSEKASENLNTYPEGARCSFEIVKDGQVVVKLTMNYLKEIRAALTANLIA